MNALLSFLREYPVELLLVLLATVLLGVVAAQWYDYYQCSGDFVRGVFWFRCLR